MEGDKDNFIEIGRSKSAQNSAGNDWHVSIEKEWRFFRVLEPSEFNQDEDEAYHKNIHTWTFKPQALPNITMEKCMNTWFLTRMMIV